MTSAIRPTRPATDDTPRAPRAEAHARWAWLAPLLAGLAAAAVLLPRLGLYGMYNWDESIYANVARQILKSGDWLNLQLNGEPYVNKPPLFIYLDAMALRALGESDASARVVAALFAVGNVVLAWFIARRLFGMRVAALAALLMLAHRDFLSISRHGRMESAVSFFIAIAFWAVLNARDGKSWRPLFCVSVALAVLTKGPMGTIPVIVALALWALDRRLRTAVSWRDMLVCAGAIAALTLPWFLLQYAQLGDAYLQRFLWQQNLDRLSMSIEGHRERPWWYYLDVIAVQNVSSWGLLGVGVLGVALWRIASRRGDEIAALGIYALVIIGLASFVIQTKLPHYAYAAYVPLACLTAWWLSGLQGRWRRVRHGVVALSVLVAVGFQPTLREKNAELRALAGAIHTHCPPGRPIAAIAMDHVALHWYADRLVELLPGWHVAAGPAQGCAVAPVVIKPGEPWRLLASSSRFALWQRGESHPAEAGKDRHRGE